MNNTRLIMLIARFHPVVGGTEKQALALAGQLQENGLGVQVLTARLKGLPKQETIKGVQVRRLFSAGAGFLGTWTFMISSFLYLTLNRKNYDLIQVFLAGSPAISAKFAWKMIGKKVVLKLGGAGPTGDVGTAVRTGWGKRKLNYLRTGIAAYVVPTREIAREITDYGFPENKIRHIANGVDADRFRPVSLEEKVELRRQLKLPWRKIVACSGRLEPGKGMEILLTGWENVYRQFPEAHLLILGEGRLKQDLAWRVAGSELREIVHFLGLIEEPEKYLQCSDLFVLPSLAEGLSNALLEAMSCGLPVVATELAGTKEVINAPVNGLLARAGDPGDLGEKICTLLDVKTDGSAMGAAARATVQSGYAIKLIAQKYETLYQNLLKEV